MLLCQFDVLDHVLVEALEVAVVRLLNGEPIGVLDIRGVGDDHAMPIDVLVAGELDHVADDEKIGGLHLSSPLCLEEFVFSPLLPQL
jgi:hypothetical protein